MLEAGFDYTVGIGGSQLTPQQRQKLALAAAALRQVRVLVADAPTRDLHRGAATTVLARLLEIYQGRTVICALDDADARPPVRPRPDARPAASCSKIAPPSRPNGGPPAASRQLTTSMPRPSASPPQADQSEPRGRPCRPRPDPDLAPAGRPRRLVRRS